MPSLSPSERLTHSRLPPTTRAGTQQEDELLMLGDENSAMAMMRGSRVPSFGREASGITSMTDESGNVGAVPTSMSQTPLGRGPMKKGTELMHQMPDEGMDAGPWGSAARQGAMAEEEEPEINGMTTVMFSVSAGEGRNIVLRNFIGKIAANLSLMSNLPQPDSTLQFIDAFADEGHRLGAYYLQRAVCIAFYEAMSRPVALQVAKQWLDAMNSCEQVRIPPPCMRA